MRSSKEMFSSDVDCWNDGRGLDILVVLNMMKEQTRRRSCLRCWKRRMGRQKFTQFLRSNSATAAFGDHADHLTHHAPKEMRPLNVDEDHRSKRVQSASFQVHRRRLCLWVILRERAEIMKTLEHLAGPLHRINVQLILDPPHIPLAEGSPSL